MLSRGHGFLRSCWAPTPLWCSAVLALPTAVNEMEKRSLISTMFNAGMHRTQLLNRSVAAALGAGLDIRGPKGQMVVDIGCGTTDIAVLTLNGVASSSSLEVAGNTFDEAIARYVRKKHSIVIGQATAEDIKIQIGSVYERPEVVSMNVRGRDSKTGRPREVTINSSEIFEPLNRLGRQIADEALSVLEETSPELVSDIAENGITLTGGGSQIWGMDKLLTERTETMCSLADDPDSCVAYGCGKSLSWINHMNEGPINIARKRILKG